MTRLEKIKEHFDRPGYVEYINPTTLRPTRDARPDIDWLVERVERLAGVVSKRCLTCCYQDHRTCGMVLCLTHAALAELEEPATSEEQA